MLDIQLCKIFIIQTVSPKMSSGEDETVTITRKSVPVFDSIINTLKRQCIPQLLSTSSEKIV